MNNKHNAIWRNSLVYIWFSPKISCLQTLAILWVFGTYHRGERKWPRRASSNAVTLWHLLLRYIKLQIFKYIRGLLRTRVFRVPLRMHEPYDHTIPYHPVHPRKRVTTFKLKCVSAKFILRTYATKYFPCWNMFNTLHTVCFMHELSIYKIKRICHRAYFFRISYWSFQHLTNFLKI